MDLTTGIILILGLLTVGLSLTVAMKFYSYTKKLDGKSEKLSFSIFYQLIGEATIGFGTLLFAAAAHFDWLQEIGGPIQSTMRFIMFLAASATTWHLLRTLKKMEKGKWG
jgi:hypothetical protein